MTSINCLQTNKAYNVVSFLDLYKTIQFYNTLLKRNHHKTRPDRKKLFVF